MTRPPIHWGRHEGTRIVLGILAVEAAVDALTAALNVLVVYWLGQLAFPSLGFVPPTILGAAGLTGLAWILRRPIVLREGEGERG